MKKILSISFAMFLIELLMLLFGDGVLLRWRDFSVGKIEKPILRNDQVAVVVFRRGRGGASAFPDAGKVLQALSYDVFYWGSEQMNNPMQETWGVDTLKFHDGGGAVYYPSGLELHARNIQKVLTKENPVYVEALPLVEARSRKDIPILNGALSGNSILVYMPG